VLAFIKIQNESLILFSFHSTPGSSTNRINLLSKFQQFIKTNSGEIFQRKFHQSKKGLGAAMILGVVLPFTNYENMRGNGKFSHESLKREKN